MSRGGFAGIATAVAGIAFGLAGGSAMAGPPYAGVAVDFNYGIIPNGHVHIQAPLAFDAPGNGPTNFDLGDTELGFKYRFVEEDEKSFQPMIGVYPLVDLPSGDVNRALGAGYTRAYFPVWVQKSFDGWTAFGGGGYWLNHGGGTVDRDYWYIGWALQRQVTRELALGAELFHQTATLAFGATDPAATRETTGINFGATYDIAEHHHLLASIGTGLQNAQSTNLLSWYLGYRYTSF
jgi:hypothetical protein